MQYGKNKTRGTSNLSCLVCGNQNTIKAHLIPRAFALEVTRNGEKHILFSEGEDAYRTTNTGVFDPSILCADCDGILGSHEGKVYQELKFLREENSGKSEIVVTATSMPQLGESTDYLIRFSAGLLWKYGVRNIGEKLPLGPYLEILKDIAFRKEPIPSSIDLCVALIAHDNEQVYFYREPYPVRIEGTNGASFSVGRFLFFVKLDQRPNPEFFGRRFWIRGKSFLSFPIEPPSAFPEYNEIISAEARPRIASYLQRMRGKD